MSDGRIELGEVSFDPTEIQDFRLSVEGTSDTGKTNSLAVILEDLAEVSIPTLIVERVGALSTVRHEDDDIVVVGGKEEEAVDLVVPLQELDQIGNWVLDKGMKVLLDVSTYSDYSQEESRVHLAAGKAVRSLNDRAQEKYKAGSRTKSLLVIDEAHYMAPKDNAPEPELDDNVKMCRGQIIKACTEGGNKGISTIVSYQRRAFLHNGVISLCKDWIVHGLANEDAAKVAKKLNIDRDLIDELGVGEILARGDNLTSGELVGPTKVRKRSSPDPREEEFEIPETSAEKQEVLNEIQESIEERKEEREEEKSRVEELEEKVEQLQDEKEEMQDSLENREELRKALKGLNETDSSSSEDVQEISERAEELEEENEELRNRLEVKENKLQELREERDHLQEEYEALEEKFESRLQGLNSLRSAFQQLGLASEGEVTVDGGVSEDDVENIVEDKLSDFDAGSTGESVSDIEDLVLSDFQEDAVNSLMEEVEDLSERQRKLLLFIEAKGKNLPSKKEWANGALGFVNGDVYNDMNDLQERGFVEKNAAGNVKPATERKVRDELSPYDPDDGDVGDVKKRILQKVKEAGDSE
ncbi:hypothetical protein KY092_08020 [Natronomonas gomsonensis]|uniref:hypothetical protein n=1 Tax=Natronomonas gomsonensis TaxID=1046043 RepID=UPI0020CA9509|nr:hypothetical protein [Natronomonas gomsonensis]MCY4730503.1 hypothetical protein [Natronomonas gomsonensis]